MATVPENFQMEVIDMQNNTGLNNVFFSVNIANFYKSHVSAKCKANNVSVCEQLFSIIKLIKTN